MARAEVDRRWHAGRNRQALLERRLPNGRVGLAVAYDDSVGFRVWAPCHGCYLVAPDGRLVLAAPPTAACGQWERLVLAQVLPLAAVLRGMDLLHASAVELGGRAVAFLGRSGAGKTTVAAHCVARGARLLTDDVLAIEAAATGVRAHRGGAVMRLDPRELQAMTPPERERFGTVNVDEGKWHATPPLATPRLPLGLTYHLMRDEGGEGVSITRVRPYDPVLLLGNTFLPYLTGPARLERQLELWAAIASGTSLFQIRVGPDAGSRAVAGAVLGHARRALGGRVGL
jgi:hypothetical protein